MNKVFKLIAFILIFSFLIDKLIYFSLNKISDNVFSGQSIGKLNKFLSVKDTKDVIVFGSSRAHHHIDVNQVTNNGYNMGVDGRFIAYSATLMKLLPKEKEQLIIFHLDPERAIRQNYNGDDILALNVKYHRDNTIRKEIDKLNLGRALQQFYWSIDYNGKTLGILENLINPKKEDEEENGFAPIEVTAIQKEVFQKTLKRTHAIECKEDQMINDLYVSYLQEIKELENKNKKVVVVTSPTYSDECKIDNKLLAQLLLDLEITYIDFSDFFNENNSIDYWRDKTHLSDFGAEIFTKSFTEWLSTL